MMLAFSPWTVFHALVSSQPIMQLKVQNQPTSRRPSYPVGSFQLVSHLDLDLDLVLVLLPLGKAVLCVLLLSLAFAMMLVVCLPGCKLIAMLIAPMC